jgi:hypothetical protein
MSSAQNCLSAYMALRIIAFIWHIRNYYTLIKLVTAESTEYLCPVYQGYAAQFDDLSVTSREECAEKQS